jgi:hypothetical protein
MYTGKLNKKNVRKSSKGFVSSAKNQNEKRFSSVYGVNITEWNLSFID